MFPPGSPFEQFFKDFLNRNRPGPGGRGDDASRRRDRRSRAWAPASSSMRPGSW